MVSVVKIVVTGIAIGANSVRDTIAKKKTFIIVQIVDAPHVTLQRTSNNQKNDIMITKKPEDYVKKRDILNDDDGFLQKQQQQQQGYFVLKNVLFYFKNQWKIPSMEDTI
jgi:hypothetical protein